MVDKKKQVPLRISSKLYHDLARWAEDDFRSINGQIEYILTECVKQRKKSGKKDDPIACKKKIAYIPDNPDLYEYMTARQYINFIQDVFEVGNERFERIEKYAKIFSIEKDLDQPIASFSHGMKQKVALIAAWVHQPKLVIMDEPFVGLDPTASHLLKQMMRELCEEGGAIFFSTHVLEVAEKLCDHIAIIKEGKLLKTGTMEEVKGDASLETVFLEMENESV